MLLFLLVLFINIMISICYLSRPLISNLNSGNYFGKTRFLKKKNFRMFSWHTAAPITSTTNIKVKMMKNWIKKSKKEQMTGKWL